MPLPAALTGPGQATALLAITIGLSLVGLSAAFQQLTFAGALKHLHPVAHAELPHGVRITAKGDEVDRIVGLEVGADDYLPKPFNPRELVARIQAVLRRRPAAGPPGAPTGNGWVPVVTRGQVAWTRPGRTSVRSSSWR